MKLPRRRFLQLAAGVAALPAVSRLASAQAYPSKPITIVVVLAERMRSSLGQTVIIENTTGAGGTIAVSR
jgi:tripartite-type tricarboxylate transporter receptor subunit TctC